MKIILINYMETLSPGGINTVVRETAKNLSSNGHEVIVIQPNPMNFKKIEHFEGFKIIRIKSKFSKYFYDLSIEMYKYLKRNLEELNPNVVHVHGYHTLLSIEIIYLIKRINYKIPIIFSPHFGILSHDSFAGKNLFHNYNNFIGKWIVNYTDTIISASFYESENIAKYLEVPNEKITVVSHGINCIDLYKEKEENNAINLLFVGYLLELKGIQYIIETLHELIYNRKVKTYLKIVGEGPYENELKKLAEKLNVTQFIVWENFIPHSQIEKLNSFYKKSDIFLLLSQSENYGIVVQEALAMGTPVIVTKRTALNEFLNEHGCFGVDYPPNSKEVADLVMKIYENNLNVGPFSDKIRTWDKVTSDYEKVYDDLSKNNHSISDSK